MLQPLLEDLERTIEWTKWKDFECVIDWANLSTFVHPSTYRPIYPSFYIETYLSIFLSAYICICIYLPFYLSIYWIISLPLCLRTEIHWQTFHDELKKIFWWGFLKKEGKIIQGPLWNKGGEEGGGVVVFCHLIFSIIKKSKTFGHCVFIRNLYP